MNVLEHRYKRGDREGRTYEPTTKTDMVVVGVQVKGARDARVTLGSETLTPPAGVTPCMLQVPAGSAIAIEFGGEGAVELLGVRVPRTKTMGPVVTGQPCPVCEIVVGDPIEHRCFRQPKAE